MADVFISYSRSDITFARKLNSGISEAGLESWIDWEDIPPSSAWMAEIQEAIEQADAFIFILSNKSVDSEVCSREVTFAHENGKRLIPIVIDDIDPSSVPPFVAALNWIFFRESDDFQTSLERLLEAIHTDQVWVKSHTRLQNRALEWDRTERSNAFLLHGADLEEAESFLTQAQTKDPPPTTLQREYILAGRNAVARQRRLILGLVGAGLVLALSLSTFAFTQRGVAIEQRDLQATAEAQAVAEAQTRATAEAEAVEQRDARATAQAESQVQRDVAISQYLASESLSLTAYQLERKLLLAIEALQFHSGIEARRSLLEALIAEPYFFGITMRDEAFTIQSLALSYDGTRLAIGSNSGEVRVLDTESGAILHDLTQDAGEHAIVQLALSTDNRRLVSVDEEQKALLWDLDDADPQGKALAAFPAWESFLAINQDGSQVAGITTDGEVAIWDNEGESILKILDGSSREDGPIFFSPDGGTIAAFHAKEEIYLWNTEDGKRFSQSLQLSDQSAEPRSSPQPLQEQYTLAFNAQGDELVAGDGYETFHWDIPAGAIYKNRSSILSGFNKQNMPMAFSRSAFEPYQWNFETGKTTAGPLAYSLATDFDAINLLGFAWNPITEKCFFIWKMVPQGTWILHYDFNDPTPLRHQIPDTANLITVATDPKPGSDVMITAGCLEYDQLWHCSQGVIQFWDSSSGEALSEPITAGLSEISSVAISPGGETFATMTARGGITFWDLESRSPNADPKVSFAANQADHLRFHPSGSYIAVRENRQRGNDEKYTYGIQFVDVETGERIGDPITLSNDGQTDSVEAFAFSPDGKSMAVTQRAKNLTVWNITNPEDPILRYSVELEQEAHSVTYHPEGGQIAIGMLGQALLVDAKTGEILFSPQGYTSLTSGSVYGLQYSPDGVWLAAHLPDDQIQLMDGASGVPIGPPLLGLNNGGLEHNTLAFSADGKRIISTNKQRDILIWDLDLQKWQSIACQMIKRDLNQDERELYMADIEPRQTCPMLP